MMAGASKTASEEWVTLPEAMRLLGKERASVLMMIVRGELVADIRGRWTFVSRDSIDRWCAANPS